MGPENNRRRGLLFFAIFVIAAQAGLFIFLKLRSSDAPEQVAATAPTPEISSSAAAPPEAQIPAPKAPDPTPAPSPTPAPTPTAEPPTPVPEPPKETPPPPPQPEPKQSPREERAERERDRRAQVARDKEARERAKADAEREKQRLDAEREKQRLETEREKARAEAEKASQEKVRLEAEKKRLELEKARLEQENKNANATPTVATPPKMVQPVKPAGSPEVLVVLINPSAGVSSLSRDEIRAVYFGRTTIWPNNRAVRPYNRPAASSAGKKFFANVLRSSAGDFRQHWDSLQLSGNGIAPGTIASADSMVARVAATSGAIGYILESELPADLKGLRLMRIK